MNARQAHDRIVRPALLLAGPTFSTLEARLMLTAIGLQESNFAVRDQVDAKRRLGPATGFLQFEEKGGCDEIARLRRRLPEPLRDALINEAQRIGVNPASRHDLWVAFATPAADALHMLCGRALLFWTPGFLPNPGSVRSSFEYYKKGWRPGRPSWTRWRDTSYPAALKVVWRELRRDEREVLLGTVKRPRGTRLVRVAARQPKWVPRSADHWTAALV